MLPDTHLSSLTPFVGREKELAEILDRLVNPACRLLTLTGLGGIGKTRLALESGRMIGDSSSPELHAEAVNFPDGVWFVSLQPITSADLMVPTIADSLKFTFYGRDDPRKQLLDFLRERQLLLLLDNFEHLPDGVDLLLDILEAAPRVKILVTSRDRLHLREEWVMSVTGLPFPAVDSSDGLDAYSAIQLFMQTARRAGYMPQDSEAAAIARICQMVEGIPLAIELAAAWTRAIPCAEIAHEIAHGLDILTTAARNVSEKHRSMRAVFEHSWLLLSKGEQTVFKKLSVFRGGFLREAAEAITGATLMTLAAFVDKSLLRVSPDGRYDLHELLRQYGDEQLESSGETEDVHAAHSGYYAHFIIQRVEDLKGRRQTEAVLEIESDFENIRTAWNWAAAARHQDNIETMLEGMRLFGNLRSRDRECRALFQYAERQFAPERGTEPQRIWAKLLVRAVEDTELPQSPLETALQIAHRHHDLAEIAFCLERLGAAAYINRDYATAKQLLEQSLSHYRRLGDPFYVVGALFDLITRHYESRWEESKIIYDEALRLTGEIGDKVGRSRALWVKANGEARVGNYAESERFWYERIALGHETGNLYLVALGYANLSYQVCFVQGDFTKSRTAAEEAVAIATRANHVDARAWALVTLGVLSCMEERYIEGKRLCQQADSSAILASIFDYAAWGLSIVACGLEDYETASVLLPAGLKFGKKVLSVVGIIMCLPVAAVIFTHQGDHLRAVELLGLAFTHPVRAYGWMEKWPLLTRLRTELETALGSQVYADAWERGKLLDPDVIAVALQAQFRAEHTKDGEIAPLPSDPIIDTLTERELEIIQLIANGLTSREIAQSLYLTVGTIHWYRKEIYSKLHVHSRAQAIARARELNLLP